MTTISAQTILRSRHSERPDKILSTLLLRYPRFIHAEFMTHRAFSRNAASSRAIPVKKLIQDVIENPAIPLHWGKNQPGMQAIEETNTRVRIPDYSADPFVDFHGNEATMEVSRQEAWEAAMHHAISIAEGFAKAGYHKQIVNRLLEPFSHITVLVSATEWDNFLELRDHEDAEPHIAILAREVRRCLERTDDIQTLQPGEWHMPLVTDAEADVFGDGYELEDCIKLSVARCASTSYKTVDGFNMTLERATSLHDRLLASKPIHASPAEHIAQADALLPITSTGQSGWWYYHQHRNFSGFRQYRAIIGA